jgi:TolB-like protein
MMGDMTPVDRPGEKLRDEDAHLQLAKILASPAFQASERLKALLAHIVEQTLAGNTNGLLGKNIQQDVCGGIGADAEGGSSTVRVEIGRVRRRLHEYYDTDGKMDRVRIDIPKGAYTASFAIQETAPSPLSGARKTVAGRHRSLALLAALVTVLVMLSVGAGWFWHQRDTRQSGGVPVVAVMPLEQLGTAYPLGDIFAGIVADLVTDLSRVSGLRVISTASSGKLASGSIDLVDAGRRLGASHLVHGTVQFDGTKFRLNLGLFQMRNNHEIWAQRFEFSDAQRFAAQTKIAEQVSRSLPVVLGSARKRLSTTGLASDKARLLYRQSKDLMNPPTDTARAAVAKSMLQKVIETDPGSALGYAGLAYAMASTAWFRPPADLARVLSEVERLAGLALERDPGAAPAYVGLCIVALINRQFAVATENCGTAVAVQPSNDLAHAFNGLIHVYSGRMDQGVDSLLLALNLNPLEPRTGYLNMLGQAYFHDGQYELALEAFQRSVREGGPVGPHIVTYLAATHAATGDKAAARATLRQIDRFGNDFAFEGWLRRTFKDAKEAERASRLLSELN